MASLQAFKTSFQGPVTIEGDADYSIRRWADNASHKAKYVVYPRNAEDIAKAIKFATFDNLDLAIRGGGHATSGASSSEGGMFIDLYKFLKGVRIDSDKKLAYAQGGAIWETVDAEAIKHGLPLARELSMTPELEVYLTVAALDIRLVCTDLCSILSFQLPW